MFIVLCWVSLVSDLYTYSLHTDSLHVFQMQELDVQIKPVFAGLATFNNIKLHERINNGDIENNRIYSTF